MAIGVILASLVIVRWITKPLRLLGAAAQSMGQVPHTDKMALAPVPESGPREVAEAARAFNDMQRRIAGLIEDRTLSLAAISHDLKTPLTRLRLQVEDVTVADQKARMIADIGEMEQMIDGSLAFLRGVPDDQPPKPYDVGAIADTICSDLIDQGHDVRLEAGRNMIAIGHPLQIKRALTNLIQNAVRHGGNARVRVTQEAGRIVLAISDDGPGIPAEKLDDVRRPFTRLDDARGDPSGSGLGLAVAERLITGQGGKIILTNRAPQGLEVLVQLIRP